MRGQSDPDASFVYSRWFNVSSTADSFIVMWVIIQGKKIHKLLYRFANEPVCIYKYNKLYIISALCRYNKSFKTGTFYESVVREVD